MKEKSLVSVIVPIYKVEQYLDECVESIVNQTYKNLEIILVDDGSPDGCPQMCDEWLRKDGRIKVIHKKNGGLSSARNAGLDAATGEFVSFVDSDDFICLEALQKLHDRFGDDESVGIVSGMIYRYQEGKTSDYNSEWFLKEEKVILGENFLQETLTQKTSFTVWNKLYRRTLLAGVFFREGRNNEDSLFMYDLGKKICNMNVCMVEIPHYVYYYRYREDSICTTSKTPLALDALGNFECMMQDCEGKDSSLHDVLYCQYTKMLFEFVDSLLLNPVWHPLYFKEYQAKLRRIKLRAICGSFHLNDILYIQLLKWSPSLRKIIKKLSLLKQKRSV